MPEISPPPPDDVVPPAKRIAFLVIHGIGQQSPYETLDQFARGLLSSYEDEKPNGWKIFPQLEICKDPNHAQQDWVRASYRLAPAKPVAFMSDLHPSGDTIDDISLFEYYWAPITQDKISYTGSLLFLIKAGLQPFLYMGANINAIGKSQPGRLYKVVFREIVRQFLLFLPLLLLLFATLAWLGSSKPLSTLEALRHPSATMILTGVLLFIRYLYAYTSGNALYQSLRTKSGWQKSWIWRATMLLVLLFNVVAWPLYQSAVLRFVARLSSFFARLSPWLPAHLGHWSGLLRTVAARTELMVDGGDWTVSVKAFLFLDPTLSKYFPVLLWLGLAAFVRFILINYVGDVAVYVNASELAKNFAARSQILDECTGALTGLLKVKVDRANPQSAPLFDQIYVAGHSLGSVIAYDTINTLLDRARTATPSAVQIQAADLDRLRGMVTFGSPLNKIFYFFRENIDPRQVLRSQTLDLLHGFRVLKNLKRPGGRWEFEPVTDADWNRADYSLDHNFRWINAYSIQDPVSGRLIFYDLENNDNQMQFNGYPPIIAHLRYWRDPKFYAFIRQRIL